MAGKTSGSGKKPRSSNKKYTRKTTRRKTAQDTFMVLRLLILVALVLVVFEGKLIHTMFSQHSGAGGITTASASQAAPEEPETQAQGAANSTTPATGDTAPASNGGVAVLAGLAAGDPSGSASSQAAASTASADGTISEVLHSDAVVPVTEPPIDDSYFRDAVFIGDSRMEGFRNTSGITQGEFLTSVGMSISSLGDAKVNTSDGEITVYQGLSGRQYGKIYLMLGTNDLGYYPWEAFLDNVEEVLQQFHRLQPGAVIYVCGVIYVEGQKISTDYVNNDNVRKVNGYLLNACEDLPYCYYLNLNEIFSNGYGALIDGATADGVHLQPQYSSMMLEYLKSHYVTNAASSEEVSTEGEA